MSKKRLFAVLIGAVVAAALVAPAFGQNEERIDVIQISGNLDSSALSFVAERIGVAASAGSQAAIIAIDSNATLTEDIVNLVALVENPPLPVVVWVGPNPASAFGGAAHLLAAAPLKAAAPGAEIGHAFPLVAGSEQSPGALPALRDYTTSVVVVSEPVEGLVDIVAPSISNLLFELDGVEVSFGDSMVTLETLRETEDGTGAILTVFSEPGPGVRTLRTGLTVEAAFFFLVIGLTVAVFEFYAIGPGVAAVVAIACLMISGYGLALLPLRWWAVALTVVALWFLTVDFQRGGAGPLTAYGAIMLFVGGLFFADAAPQIESAWGVILVIVVSVVAFYVFAMSTVARSRFSTPTIGREYLIGRRGVAVTEFGPNGHVEIDGARWQAAAHREAGLQVGDAVEIVGVDGLFLEIEPVE